MYNDGLKKGLLNAMDYAMIIVEAHQERGRRKGGEMTTITIEARIPTNPEYYGHETSGVEAEDLAKGVREIYEAVLPRWFPNDEINICLVPEISSFGNQTHVYAKDMETEMEILREVEEAEETIWSSFCHNNLQVKPTIDRLLAKPVNINGENQVSDCCRRPER